MPGSVPSSVRGAIAACRGSYGAKRGILVKPSPTGLRPFKPGEERARVAGSKGGKATAADRRKVVGPYTGSILNLMDAAGMKGESWAPWRSALRVVYGLPLAPEDVARYTQHTGRTTPPTAPFREVTFIIGRRGGKSQVDSAVALHKALSFDARRLAPGESGRVLFLAADREQASITLRYTKALCHLPAVQPYVHRVLKDRVELHTGVDLLVGTSDYRAVRGYTIVACVADELAFWSVNSESANPDTEVLNAVRPGMVTVVDSLLLGISSPYAQRGELYAAFKRSFGVDGARELVWVADTRSMNPSAPQADIDAEFERDPVSAASEFGRDGTISFRRDVEAFVDMEAVERVTVQGRREVPPVRGTAYVAFADPSGGSQDAFTLAIAHREGKDRAVLDAVRLRRPPFSPDAVVEEFSDVLRGFGVSMVAGDHYAGEWPREAFRRHGITYVPSDRTRSDLYRELLPPLNAARVELLDLPTLRAQLVGLERRVGRSGKDSIDHAPGAHDDLANAAAGALVNALPLSGKKVVQWSSMTPKERAAAGLPAPPAPPKLGNRGTPYPMPGYVDDEEPGFGDVVSWSASASPAFRRATGSGE